MPISVALREPLGMLNAHVAMVPQRKSKKGFAMRSFLRTTL
jgi:hypothetical protein